MQPHFRPLHIRMKGEDIMQLQQSLRRLGYAIKDREAYFGKGTRRVVKDFQEKHRLEPNGEVDEATAACIEQAVREQYARPEAEEGGRPVHRFPIEQLDRTPENQDDLSEEEQNYIREKLDTTLRDKIIELLPVLGEAAREKIREIPLDYPELKEQSIGQIIEEKIFPLFEDDEEVMARLEERNLAGRREFTQKVGDFLQLDTPLREHPLFSREVHATHTGELARIAGADEELTGRLVELEPQWDRRDTTLLDQWQEEGLIDAAKQRDILYTFELADLTGDNLPLTERLKDRQDIQSTRDLMRLDREGWLALIEAAGDETPEGVTREQYADNLMGLIEQSYPSDALFHRITKARQNGGLEALRITDDLLAHNDRILENGRLTEIDFGEADQEQQHALRQKLAEIQGIANTYRYLNLETIVNDRHLSVNDKIESVGGRIGQLETFYRDNPEVDLRFADFFDPDAANWDNIAVDEQPKVRKQLMAYQRVLDLSPDTQSAMTLLRHGLDSDVAIARMTLPDFVRRINLPLNAAESIHRKARTDAAQLIHTMHALREMQHNTWFGNKAFPATSSELVNELKDLEGYDDLFGSLNYCNCEHCKSILSPAAYFVDLMYYVDEYVKKGLKDDILKAPPADHPMHLKNRRPDLWELPFTCEHTHQLLPYLEIVNRTLARYLEQSFQIGDAFQVLSGAQQSFQQPFNLPLEELRLYLSHFELKLAEVYETLGLPIETRAREWLELSPEEFNLISEPANAEGVQARYGLHGRLARMNVQDFLDRSGISREDLDELLKTTFANPDESILIEKKLVKDSVNQYEEHLIQLNTDKLDRLHRFIRLWRKAPWTIRELGFILDAVRGRGRNLRDEIVAIGQLVYIQEKLGLTPEEVASLATNLPQRSISIKRKEAGHIEYKPPFRERIFEAGKPIGEPVYHPALDETAQAGPDERQQLTWLAGGLRVSDADLLRVIELTKETLIQKDNGQFTGQFNLTDEAASLLFRQTLLARGMGLSLEEFVYLVNLHLGASEYVKSLDQIIDLIRIKERIEKSPFSLSEIWFLLTGGETSSIRYRTTEYTVAEFIDHIRKQHPLVFDRQVFSKLKGITAAAADELFHALLDRGEIADVQDGKQFRLTSNYQKGQNLGPIFNAIQDQGIRNKIAQQVDEVRKTIEGYLYDPRKILPAFLTQHFQLSSKQHDLFITWLDLQFNEPALITALHAAVSEGKPSEPQAVGPLFQLIRELERAVRLFEILELDADAAGWIFQHQSVFGLLDWQTLDLESLLRLSSYRQWRKLAGPEEIGTLHDLLAIYARQGQQHAQPRAFTFEEAQIDAFCRLTKLERETAASVVRTFSFPAIAIMALDQLKKQVDLCARLGIDGPALKQLQAEDYPGLQPARDIVYKAFKARYTDEKKWEEAYFPYRDKINERKRDALCDCILSLEPLLKFKNKRELLSFFLLDVEMEGCLEISMLKAAILSLQLYVHRVLMNLEQSETGDFVAYIEEPGKAEWEWRKNYRVWEANRKVFLYPENWIEPELRDDKTPFFKELEDELLQEEITLEAAEKAYIKYFQQFEEVAKLKIAGVHYFDDPNGIDGEPSYYIFGRTATDPYQYYYRRYFPCTRRWKDYEKVELNISAPFVSPIVYQGRLFVFWVEVETKEKEITIKEKKHSYYEHDIYVLYSYQKKDGMWLQPQKMDLRYHIDSREDHYGFEDESGKAIDEYTDNINWLTNSVNRDLTNPNYIEDLSSELSNPKKDFQKYFFEKSATCNKVYLYVSSNNLFLTYCRKRLNLKFDATIDDYNYDVKKHYVDRKVDLFSNQLNASKNYAPANQTFFLRKSFGQKGTYYLCKENPGLIWDPTLDDYLSLFSSSELKVTSNLSEEPILKVVHNRSGDSIFYYQNQQFLIYQLNCHFPPKKSATFHQLTEILKLLQTEKEAIRLTTSVTNNLQKILFEQGLEELLQLSAQQKIKEEDNRFFDIMKWKQLWVYNEGNHLNFNGPFGPYFRELFFHIPFLIANHLNANQKFKEAKYWYDKIFDPTQDNPWQYIEFREAGKATFQKILSDTAALKAYEKDPFSPHAIARKRISAYQKAVVMKYIDNLLDWGDHLFTQDTFETINEALMLYVLAYDLLGERPKQIGQCERPADRVLTYGHIQPYLPPDPKHEQPAPFLIEMKNWQQRYYRKMITAHFEGAQANNGKPWEYQIPDGLRFNYRYPEDIITAHPPTKPEPVPVDQVQPANPPAAQLFWSAPTRIAETYRGYAERKTPAPQSGNLAVDRMPQGYKPAPEQSIGRQETLYIEDRQEQVFCVPPNPNLLEYWNRVEDRLYKIRHCMNIKGVRRTLLLWEPEIDPGLLVAAKAKGVGLEDVIVMLQGELPPYRFAFMLEKARSFAATVSSFGSALLSALEKKDGEELALIKSRQEQNVLKLTRTIKKKQVEEAKAKWEALLEGKKQVQQKIDYYQDLISNGLIAGEHTQQDLTHWATARLGTSILYYFFGAKADLFPKILGFAFSTPAWGAEKASEKVAKVYDLISSILKSAAEAAGLEAHYERRAQEWHQQLKLTEQELVQTKKQTLAAKIAHQITEKDQEIHEKNIEQSKELYDFYQDKFTALGLYNYLATSLSRLYREAYGLALRMARQAERCYQFERDDDKIFIEGGNWEAGRAGLLAGEKLLLQLQEMEQAYLENNVRDYEVTQSFSMLMLDPEALINLQKLGKCEFTIPEIAYDLFYPGQYKRMIKAVRVTIPSVAGPYQNVPCKLTLESSKVRRGATSDGKELIHAPKGWCKSIATSTATNDGGLFELNFRDERYLPFEGAGAVESKWILQLPKTICPFDYDTISDVIIHISYTAKEDEVFREKKEAEIRNELSKNTLYRLFDLKHEFPEVLHQLEQAKENVALRITKDHFPQYLKDLTFSPKSASILKVVGKKLDDNDKAVIAGVQGDQGQNIDGSWDIKLKKDYLEDGNVLVLLKYGVQYANA